MAEQNSTVESPDVDLRKSSDEKPPPNRLPEAHAQQLGSFVNRTTEHVLDFLSTASNETLAACLVGLGATTYLVLGRFGLVLIGAAGGVVLHATWEHGAGNAGDRARAVADAARRRQEIGVDVLKRALDWREIKPEDSAESGESLSPVKTYNGTTDFSDFKPDTAAALNELTDAIVRDYVKWWYSPILPNEQSFPISCRRTLTNFINAVSLNLSRKRAADTFVQFATNSSSIIIVFFNELSNALAAASSASPADAIASYLKLKPESNLANIMDSQHQRRKLQMVADDILETFLDPTVYRCLPARTFLREILADSILDVTIQRCSRAEFINEWIVYLLEDGEPEVMNVIDAGLEGSAAQQVLQNKMEAVEGNRTKAETNALSIPEEPSAAEKHKRTVSKAEEAMDEAMAEAKRLTQMIMEEEEKKTREKVSTTDVGESSEDVSHVGLHTPTSSQDEAATKDVDSDPRASSGSDSHRGTSEPRLSASPKPESMASFTSFDQMPSSILNGNAAQERSSLSETLTLHKAKASMFDDGGLSDAKKGLKSKPTIEYMIQIEPASDVFPGWMIGRTYSDFESLHEVLRRIANISGINFSKSHGTLPAWKGVTKPVLREQLEKYLRDALQYEQLAESEGMKRFLDKERGLSRVPNNRAAMFNPTNIGKGVVDNLSKGANQVAGGGKALFGGVAGAIGAVGGAALSNTVGVSAKKQPTERTLTGPTENAAQPNASNADLGATSKGPTMITNMTVAQSESESALATSPSSTSLNPSDIAKPRYHPKRSASYQSLRTPTEEYPRTPSSRSSMIFDKPAPQPSGIGTSALRRGSASPASFSNLNLPPRPDAMPDDYDDVLGERPNGLSPKDYTFISSPDGTTVVDLPSPSFSQSPRSKSPALGANGNPSGGLKRTTSLRSSPSRPPHALQRQSSGPPDSLVNASNENNAPATHTAKPSKVSKRDVPLTDPEASIVVELMFATLQELFTLSSAWSFRLTLLNAAKTYLLRPGNPQLTSLRNLLQESVLDANTSDAGIALNLRKLRENAVPTEEELKSWPAPRNDQELEELRKKARKLLMERGMPRQLTGVMGQAACGEALGRVFDALQVPELARGLVFGLSLQGIRGMVS